MQSNNEVIIASAGSRKTTYIVEEALAHPEKQTLILTYTIDNLEQIRSYFIQKNGVVPSHVKVQGWFTFLLQHGARPYQNQVLDKKRIENICFVQGKSASFVKKDDIDRYFFTSRYTIFTDKLSEFACTCNTKSDGLVIDRLEKIYDQIYIDEVQDLAGYDLEFLELLFRSRICICVVGDTRQATYATNYSPKNSQYKGQNIINLFRSWQSKGLCKVLERTECYRSNQQICDFADLLYPGMAKSISLQKSTTGHDGLFVVRKKDRDEYVRRFNPTLLQYKKSKETLGYNAINFGASKGRTFDRVLLFTTKPIAEYIQTGNLSLVGDKPKFYVAITRAKYSVAIIHDEDWHFPGIQQYVAP